MIRSIWLIVVVTLGGLGVVVTSAEAAAPAQRNWMFTQYADERVLRDERFKLYSSGKMFDIVADRLEKHDLAAVDVPDVAAARKRLQAVLDQLPPDAKLPFAPRSQSAFKIQGKQNQ